MKHIGKIIFFLSVVVLVAGCIKENLDDCRNVALYFQYMADGDHDVFSQYVEKIDLYVFDGQDRLVESVSYGRDKLPGVQGKPLLRLVPGKYRMVAVGNAYKRTRVVGLEGGDFSKMYFQHPHWGSGEVIRGHDHNYIGNCYVEVAPAALSRDTVVLKSAHIDVSVEIKGVGEPGHPKAGYSLDFEKMNAQTDLENRVNTGAWEVCSPELAYDAEKDVLRTVDFVLFRMDTCCNHLLRLTDAREKTVVEIDIDRFIREHREIDMTKQEVLLPIEIEFTRIGVEVRIPSWYIEDVTPEI